MVEWVVNVGSEPDNLDRYAMLEIKLRDGSYDRRHAYEIKWEHHGKWMDVVAYREIGQTHEVKPGRIWVTQV